MISFRCITLIMGYHIPFTCGLLLFATFSCEAASLNLDETCKFKNEKGECITITEKPKPDDKDIYCKEYYEISGIPDIPIVLNEGKRPALPMEFPHMVAIGFQKENNVTNWQCGGILISKQHVLTSGRCLRNSHVGDAKLIRLGDLNIGAAEVGPYRRDVKIQKTFIHPDYKHSTLYHDIGIAQLERPVDINPYTVPACLNTKAEIPLNELYSATGWGVTKYTHKQSPSLQKVILKVIGHVECEDKLKVFSKRKLPNGTDDSLYICVGAPNTSTCQGDSGGPLQRRNNNNGMSVVYGIISFGDSTCETGTLPEVHVRVSRYVNWIKSIIE